MHQGNVVDGDGNVETFQMLVVSDGSRENFDGRARYLSISAKVDGNGL